MTLFLDLGASKWTSFCGEIDNKIEEVHEKHAKNRIRLNKHKQLIFLMTSKTNIDSLSAQYLCLSFESTVIHDGRT